MICGLTADPRLIRRALRRMMGRHDRWAHPVLARRRIPRRNPQYLLVAVFDYDRAEARRREIVRNA